ncbi:hypothetical protein AUL39_03220 [Tractidigestivibacter scatoligenes]|uniref:Uncharacterized protein n=1 Tax=Tractidigestivibacter scatoligenes TaxID=1299998 RepID=A0A100YX73_TRASO|nr:hypothetical protein AUL39_03220 [Tractidigestivibacter scatoligenes]
MVAGAGFEPTTFWVMNESSWRLHKFSLVYLVWIHCVEQAFCVFSRLQRSVGVCFFCISNLVLVVIWWSL